MKMKKWLYRASLPVMALTLVACSSTSEPVDETVEEKSDVTLEEVYNKAMERQMAIKSLTAFVTADQNIVMDLDGETLEMKSKSTMTMDTQKEPLAFFIDGTIAVMDTPEGSMETPLKMYMTAKDGFLVLDGETNTWVKSATEMDTKMIEDLGAQGDATQQLEQLKTYIKDFKFEQSDNEYILTLNADGEQFNDLILATAGSALDDLSMDEQQILETMSFEDALYKITIDKETFDTTKFDMDFVMKMDVEGQSTTVDTKSSITFSNFDAVEAINVPEEIIQQAVEVQ